MLRALRLHAGIVDSFPKLLSHEILRPILEHRPPVHFTCHEGKLGDLLALLTSHRIDVALSDEITVERRLTHPAILALAAGGKGRNRRRARASRELSER